MASGRPVHPLFGGGGMKNELAMAAKAMNARHGGISETTAQGGKGAAAPAATPKPRPAPAATPPPAAPAARPPHPLFGGGGGLGELKSAAKSLNARHGGLSETAPTAGKGPAAAASAPPAAASSSPSSSRPPHPLMGGGGGGMSLQDQIKAKAASRNARVQSGESVPTTLAQTNKKIVPVAAPPKELTLADHIAAKAASRKERLGYNDPVLAKPEREGPREVPTANSWMAPAEKWVSAPPVEPTPEESSPLPGVGPTKTKTKTEKVTNPTMGKRIIRRKIIKKADGTSETITTIIDGTTGEEINQDGTPIKPLAETTAYETTKTVTKTTTPLNDENSDLKVVNTETSTSISNERPAYMPEPIVTITRREAPSAPEPEQEPEPEPEPEASVTVLPPKKGEHIFPGQEESQPAPVQTVAPPAMNEEQAPPPPSPQQGKARGARSPAKVMSYKVKEGGPTTTPPPTRTTSVKSSPAPTKKNATNTTSSKEAEGTVVTTTKTVTVTKKFIPAPTKKKTGLFSSPPMTKGTSKVVVTTTSSAPGSQEEVTTTTESTPKAKRGWFGGRKK